MSVRRSYTLAASAGRSAKTVRQPWVGYAPTAVTTNISPLRSVSTSSANTKSAWFELFSAASNTSDTGLLLLMTPNTIYTGDNGCLYDIGTGNAGAETAIVSNISSAGAPANSACPFIALPVFIPAGTRVAYRAQAAATGAQTMFAVGTLIRTDFLESMPRTLDVIGTTTSNSRAVALSGSSGAYATQITSATTQPYQALILVVTSPSKTGISRDFRVTLGVGPSGSEVDLCSFDSNQTSGGAMTISNSFMAFQTLPVGRYIPQGSRLAVRHNIPSNPQLLEASVIGVPYA